MHLYVYVYIDPFVCTYLCMYAYVCVYVCIDPPVRTHLCMYASVCVYVCIDPFVCTYLCMYAYLCIYLCIYVHMYICVDVYICKHVSIWIPLWGFGQLDPQPVRRISWSMCNRWDVAIRKKTLHVRSKACFAMSVFLHQYLHRDISPPTHQNRLHCTKANRSATLDIAAATRAPSFSPPLYFSFSRSLFLWEHSEYFH